MHGEELKGGQPGGSGSWAREGALPWPAPAPQGRQGSGGLTGLSVALCISMASRRPAYLVANMARTALHLPFLAHGAKRCYAGAVQVARSPVGAPAGATWNKD